MKKIVVGALIGSSCFGAAHLDETCASMLICESYSVPAYQLVCDYGIRVFGEFLYWYAKESKLSYAIKAKSSFAGFSSQPTNLNEVQSRTDFYELGVNWDPGFKVGVGGRSACDLWDFQVDWMSVSNSRKDCVEVAPFSDQIFLTSGIEVLENLWERNVLLPGFFASGNEQYLPTLYDSIHAKWDFQIDRVGAELGRRYAPGRCFTLRPSLGIAFVWTKTRFESLALATVTMNSEFTRDPSVNTKRVSDEFRNRFWGGGLSSGLEAVWEIGCGFGVKGAFSADLLWGDFKMKKEEDYFIQKVLDANGEAVTYTDSKNDYGAKYYGLQSIFDLSIGLNWESLFCCNRYYLSLFAGWQHEVLIHHNSRFRWIACLAQEFNNPDTIPVGIPFVYSEEKGTVSLGGFVFSVQFDF